MMDKDTKTAVEKHGDAPVSRPATPAKGGDRITMPDDEVLIRYKGGPAEGMNAYVGGTKAGRVYTVTLAIAATLCCTAPRHFEPVYADDRTAIEAASKQAKKKD